MNRAGAALAAVAVLAVVGLVTSLDYRQSATLNRRCSIDRGDHRYLDGHAVHRDHTGGH